MSSERKPVVVITGASRGIGLSTTKVLLEEFGTRVVAIYRTTTPELQELLHAHSDLLIAQADVTGEADLTRAIHLGAEKFAGIDGLILNAGVLDPVGPISSPDVSLADWKAHFDINFFSLIPAIRASLPFLRESKGRVVFVSSGVATVGFGGIGPYSAGKAAMNSLCRTLAAEEPDVVSVALRPGMVATNLQTTMLTKGPGLLPKADYDKLAQARTFEAEDVGHVLAALATRADPSLSGQFIYIAGEECKPYRRDVE